MQSVKNFSIKHKSKDHVKVISAAAIFLLFLVVLNIFLYPVKNFTHKIFSPAQGVFWSAGASSSNFLANFLKAGIFAKENADLREQNQNLIFQIASLKSLYEQNKVIGDAITLSKESGLKFTAAGVIGLDGDDIMSIDKGFNDGIREGMPVINQENILFGKVFKVYKDFSQIMLISHKNSVVDVAVLQTQAETKGGDIGGVVKGSGELNAFLDLIPIDREINFQDILITSSIDKSFPKDLLVAKILQREKNDQKPFQQAQIDLFLNLANCKNLFVITNYKQTALP